jgi:hypothetical protein
MAEPILGFTARLEGAAPSKPGPGPYGPGATSSVIACDGASGAKPQEILMCNKFAEAFSLWKQRQRKYGMGNIAQFGAAGCVVRSADKLARLSRVYIGNSRTGDMTDESVRDAWLDLVNYALMGLMCHDGGPRSRLRAGSGGASHRNRL